MTMASAVVAINSHNLPYVNLDHVVLSLNNSKQLDGWRFFNNFALPGVSRSCTWLVTGGVPASSGATKTDHIMSLQAYFAVSVAY
jgi:hypothetical protein